MEVTARQFEILKLRAQGVSYHDISLMLNISISTIETHIRRASVKNGLSGVEIIKHMGEFKVSKRVKIVEQVGRPKGTAKVAPAHRAGED